MQTFFTSIHSFISSKFLLTPFQGKKGFTLLELLVVVTIATLITTAVVIKQNSWNNQLAVSTQAYESTLMVRQAQIYSLGVKVDSAATTADKFNASYGVCFDNRIEDGQPVPNTYSFFSDRNGNHACDLPNEAVETKTLTKGVTLGRICGTRTGGQLNCVSGVRLSIVYQRPNTSPFITAVNSSSQPISNFYAPYYVYLVATDGTMSLVTIGLSGQVSVGQ